MKFHLTFSDTIDVVCEFEQMQWYVEGLIDGFEKILPARSPLTPTGEAYLKEFTLYGLDVVPVNSGGCDEKKQLLIDGDLELIRAFLEGYSIRDKQLPRAVIGTGPVLRGFVGNQHEVVLTGGEAVRYHNNVEAAH